VGVEHPRPLLAGDDPREGTVGPIVSTVVVIAILLAGAGVALLGIIERVHDRRAAAEAASSTLPANVPVQSITIE
jgi:FlaG/FlaF family flagellin (archaellin)